MLDDNVPKNDEFTLEGKLPGGGILADYLQMTGDHGAAELAEKILSDDPNAGIDYIEREMEAGRITPAEAREFIAELRSALGGAPSRDLPPERPTGGVRAWIASWFK